MLWFEAGVIRKLLHAERYTWWWRELGFGRIYFRFRHF